MISREIFPLFADLGESILGESSPSFVFHFFADLGEKLFPSANRGALGSVNRLTTAEQLKLKLYSEKLIAELGSRAGECTSEGLLREASVKTLKEQKPVKEDFDLYSALLAAMRLVIERYYKSSQGGSVNRSTW